MSENDQSLKTKNGMVRVEVGTTWIRVACNRYGVMSNGYSLADFIRKTLHEHEWNPRLKAVMLVAKYLWYSLAEGKAYLPRYAIDSLKEYLSFFDLDIEQVNVEPIKTGKIDASMNPSFQLRDNQIPVCKFLTNELTGGFKPLALQTGLGKTASSIYAAVKLGYPTLIILQGLIDQWIDSILKFTNIPEEKIFTIKGFDSVVQLWKKLDQGYKPYIVIGSTRTLAMYCVDHQKNYAKVPSFDLLCDKIGFGTKIIDEAHLNFNTNCMLDLRMNIKMNIYLSATYQRSSRDGRRIFHMYFPEKLMYGSQFAKQYTTVQMAHYHLCIPSEDIGRFVGVHGYNHAVYERYLRRHPKYMNLFIEEVIFPLLNGYFFMKKSPGQHCLILVQTRKFAEDLFKRLSKKITDATMAIFFSGDTGSYGLESNLQEDVIISTISSCGTGRDIKGLKTCICTVSMASQPQSIQCLGRLREIPGEDTFYVDMCNDEIFSQRNHAKARLGYFKPKSKDIFEFVIR